MLAIINSIFMTYQNIITNSVVQNINMPNWWPILRNIPNLNLIENMTLVIFPIICVVRYSSVTFRMTKKRKQIFWNNYDDKWYFTIAIAQLNFLEA